MCACARDRGRGSHDSIADVSFSSEMKFSLSLVFFLVSWTSCLHAQSSPELSLFKEFVQRYNKPYVNDSATFDARFSAFKVS